MLENIQNGEAGGSSNPWCQACASLWSFLIWGMHRRFRTPRPFTQHC
jgi:hypothetical protein